MSTDEVQRPSHYLLADGREAFEAVIGPLCDTLAARGFSGRAIYAVGNALKYLSRLGAKGTGTGPTDLRKSIRYLEMALGAVEADDTALANQIYREMRDGAPLQPVKPRWYLPPGVEVSREPVAVGSPEEGFEGYEERWVWRWKAEGLTDEEDSHEACLQSAWKAWAWVQRQAPPTRAENVDEARDGAPLSAARAEETAAAIRAFHAAKGAPAAGPPPGLEEARLACHLASFPVTGAPRKVAWDDVPPGSIVWAPGSGNPAIGVRWVGGRGEWCGPHECSWEWDVFNKGEPVWVVAEGLSDEEIRSWRFRPA